MKNLFLIILGMIIGLQVQAQNQAKKFAIKSGKLEMKLDGSAKGTKTIYFDDYGDQYYEEEKSVTEISMFGVTDRSETHKILIMNKDKYWTIDQLKGKNYSGTLSGYDYSHDMVNGMTEEEQKQLVDNVIKGLGGQRLGFEDVAGFSCEKINVMGINIWVYKGLTLRSEGNIMGVISNEIMTSFEEGISIPASRFQPPSNMQFTEIDLSQQAGFGQLSMYEDEAEEALEELYPVEYPYEDFTKVVNGFNPESYARTMVMNQGGQYMALYNQGFANMVIVVATSSKNMDENDDEMNFESFSHKGKTLRYGEMENEGMNGKGILIPYDEHHMYIMIMSMPGKDKQTLLKWADELDF
jgi:hypothetical protein